jgi:Spy/CpxP family protein refolding chaperone
MLRRTVQIGVAACVVALMVGGLSVAQQGGAGGGRGGPSGGNDGGQTPPTRGSGPNGEMTALDKAMAQLRTTLANQSASPDDIRRALTGVREAGAKVQQDRAAAQADLKKILTLRQESVLVEMGQLD